MGRDPGGLVTSVTVTGEKSTKIPGVTIQLLDISGSAISEGCTFVGQNSFSTTMDVTPHVSHNDVAKVRAVSSSTC